MAAALAMSRRGHEVVVLEAFDQPRPLGSGLLIQPSGLAALRSLGLMGDALALGARVDRLRGLDLAGDAPVMKMDYADWRPGAFGLGMHRTSLFQILFDAVKAAGIELRTNAQVVETRDAVRPTLIDATGRAHGPFDLVVVADGSASRLRGLLKPRARAPLYPWGAVWANADDPDGRFDGALSQRYHRAEVMAGVLPVGRAPGGTSRQVSFFWSLRLDEMDAFFAGDFAAWKARVEGLWPDTRQILDQLAPGDLARASYRDVNVGRWDVGPFVLIGDAAHGTSPQLGQGANLGLLDGVELAMKVEAPSALGRYQRGRRLQTGPYQLFSRFLTPLFQSGGPFGAWVRRWLFAPTAQAPVLKRIAGQVLTGAFRLGPTPRELKP